MNPPVKLAFVSCNDALVAPFLARMEALYPDLPLWVVSEFQPPAGKWIPYKPNRTSRENMDRIRAALNGRSIRLSAVVLEPNTPYWVMRWLAFRLSPVAFIAFNEHLENFMLRPQCMGTIVRHILWRTKNFLRTQIRPGGALYTWLWRITHPMEMRRPIYYRLALIAGWFAVLGRKMSRRSIVGPKWDRPPGLSVVIPTRNGRDLIARLLPSLMPQLPADGEVIVVDNGSDDGTAKFLAEEYQAVRVEESKEPLSFAAAVNRGIKQAKFSHVCLINNDMVLETCFFDALMHAFRTNNALFCATAQILFPPGVRRQETGKAVWWLAEDGCTIHDFPLRCLEPMHGEDGTYVLYGSGGCSMYDAGKLNEIGLFDERIAPAYVEDLDVGWRGWQRGWPTVYAAGAKVTHYHRSTTSKYFKPDLLQSFVEYNFLRFIASHVASPAMFARLWTQAVVRLNVLATRQGWLTTWALEALGFAWKAVRLLDPAPNPLWPEDLILAIGSGRVASFPGKQSGQRERVMVVSPYLPYPLSHGGAVRIFNMMRQAARDFDQVLVAFVEELAPPASELLDLCVEVVIVKRHLTHLVPDRGRPDIVEEFDSDTMRAVLQQLVRKWDPSIMQLEFTQMAQYACDVPSILVEHDVTFDLYEQLLANNEDWETRRQYERWVRFEKEAWTKVRSVVVMSEKDRRTVGDNAVTLPNGVDLARFQSSGEPEPRRILFIGSFAHLPNVMALDFFMKDAWPHIKDATLHVIAGSRHRYYLERYADRVQLNLDEVEVEDFVSDVRPAYQRATVVIAPLVASAGTNIKIMEAMAMSKAIVSTPAGINGLDLKDEVIVVTSGKEMAACIEELFADPAKRRELEAKARKRVEQDFDWTRIGERQAELYRELIKSRSAVTGSEDFIRCSPTRNA